MIHVYKLAIRELLRLGFTNEQLIDIVDDVTTEHNEERE